MRITEKERTIIREMYLNYNSYSHISKTLKVSLSMIANEVKIQNLKEKRRECLYQLLQKKLSENKLREEIAEETGIPLKKITRIMADLNLSPDFRKIRFKRKEEIVLSNYQDEQIGINKMCKKTGFSYRFVERIYKMHGLKNEKNMTGTSLSCPQRITATS